MGLEYNKSLLNSDIQYNIQIEIKRKFLNILTILTLEIIGELMKLIICEKHRAAQRIASILSKGKANRSFFNRLSIYDFYDENRKKYNVMGLKGHVINLDFPKEYHSWNNVNPQVLIKTEPVKIVQDRSIVSFFNKIASEIDEVIIATDYDREGELIGVEGLELVQKANPDIKILRAHFSALTGQEIRNAFDNLTNVDYNLSFAANSRQIIDLKWGAVLTRFISLASKQTGKDFLSVGRVQSPTLALIVDREKIINDFKSKPYWQLQARLEKKEQFDAHHKQERFWEHDEVERIYEHIRSAQTGIVAKIESKDITEYPPSPFNTTGFIRAATTFKLTAARVMKIAEELYMNGLISYPRTDNTVYPKSISLRKILEMFKNSEFAKDANEILAQDRIRPSRGKVTATDHPPIHPVGVAKQSDLPQQNWKVYELIVRRFFATLAIPATAIATEAEIDIKSEVFIAKGYKYLEKGWYKYYTYFRSKEKSLPQLAKGDEVKVIKIEKLKKETKPPKRYSHGVLIEEMEKLGLGTKSTRHEIIQKLYSRGYIENQIPTPTVIGQAVSLALENYATIITKPDMTAKLENDMDEIAKGNIDMMKVVKESEDMLEKIMSELENNRSQIGNSIKDALKSQNTIGTCKECGGELRILTSFRNKRFIGCSNYPKCRNSYPLPQNGKIVPKDTNCKHCGAPEVMVINSSKKPWHICVNMGCENNKKSK